MKSIKDLFVLKSNKTTIFFSSIIIILIVTSPYLLYIYKHIPETSHWDSAFGKISSGPYNNMKYLVYYAFGKLVPLMLFFIWFISNKNWWYHAIIIPISVYMFQLISIINDSILLYDDMEFIYTVPITTIVVTILYFIRSQLVVYLEAMDLKKEMEKNFS